MTGPVPARSDALEDVVAWALTALVFAAIVLWSLVPFPARPPRFPGLDKAQHVLAYAALTIGLLGAAVGRPGRFRVAPGVGPGGARAGARRRAAWQRAAWQRAAWRVAGFAVLMGIVLEGAQVTAGRYAELVDVAANVLGVAFGMTLWCERAAPHTVADQRRIAIPPP